MALEEPGVQEGGATVFRAIIGAPSRAATAVVSLFGVSGPRIICTARVGQGIISEICETIVTIIQSASFMRGVQRGPGGGHLRGQSPLVVIHGGRWGRADGRVEYSLQHGHQITHQFWAGAEQ